MSSDRVVYDAFEGKWILTDYLRTPSGKAGFKSWLETQMPGADPPDMPRPVIADIVTQLPLMMTNSEIYAVEPDTQKLISYAASRLSRDGPPARFSMGDLPVNKGFIWWGGGLPENLVHVAMTGAVRATSWFPMVDVYGKDAVGIMTWREIKERPGLTLENMWVQRAGAIMQPDAKISLHINDISEADIRAAHLEPSPELMQTLVDGKNDYVKQVSQWLQLLEAFWKFVQQEVVVVTKPHVPRPLQRRADRQAWQADKLRIVLLRRRRDVSYSDHQDDGEHHEVHWSHRWVTRGHWRWQPYPSRGTVEKIFIQDFVKGPEHLPLITKNVINKVNR